MTRGVSLLLRALEECSERQPLCPNVATEAPQLPEIYPSYKEKGSSVKTWAYALDSTGYSIKMSFLKQTEGCRGMFRIKAQQVTTWHLLEDCPKPTRVTPRPPPGHRRGPCRRGTGWEWAAGLGLNQHFPTITTSSATLSVFLQASKPVSPIYSIGMNQHNTLP